MSYVFSAYGISVEHPEDWKIHINPNKTFAAEQGMMKIEKLGSALSEQASLTITWEKAEEDQDGFAWRYMEEIERSYQKTIKKQKRYALFSKTVTRHEGHEACLVHSALSANTHIVKPLGKQIDLELLQIALYCEHTGRIVVASMSASKEYFKAHRKELEEILFSLQCHMGVSAVQAVAS